MATTPTWTSGSYCGFSVPGDVLLTRPVFAAPAWADRLGDTSEWQLSHRRLGRITHFTFPSRPDGGFNAPIKGYDETHPGWRLYESAKPPKHERALHHQHHASPQGRAAAELDL